MDNCKELTCTGDVQGAVKTKIWGHTGKAEPQRRLDVIGADKSVHGEKKEYVEVRIVEIIARDNCGTVFKKSGSIEAVLDTPQQSYGSMNCGIFVCIIMERVVLSQNPTAPITPADVVKYRSRMVRVFVERGAEQK